MLLLYNKIMSCDFVYTVTRYGCNSGAHELWTPNTKVFYNYQTAYDYFQKVAPATDDKENRARRYRNVDYNEETTDEYTFIEFICQIPGYLEGDGDCAKRPQGAVIAKCKIS
jgi:hypothetical protein